MNRLPPVNWWKTIGQCFFFTLFCLSLWHMLDIMSQRQAYSVACSSLASQEEHLNMLETSLARYRLLRDRYLPCRQLDEKMVWQEITADFKDLDFSTLLDRLHFLYTDISSLYGEQGMFFLDEFQFEKKSLGNAAKDTPPAGTACVKIFTLKGRLLTPCSAE